MKCIETKRVAQIDCGKSNVTKKKEEKSELV